MAETARDEAERLVAAVLAMAGSDDRVTAGLNALGDKVSSFFDSLTSNASGDSAPGNSAPGNSAPGNSAPGNSAPGNSAPGNSAPGNSAPGGDSAGSRA